MKHVCHAEDCNEPVEPKFLMCKKHWAMVPAVTKSLIKEHFHPEQCKGLRRPTIEWIRAAKEAIYYVAKLEGKHEGFKGRNQERKVPAQQST